MKYSNIGSISTGTLDSEDLAHAYSHELERLVKLNREELGADECKRLDNLIEAAQECVDDDIPEYVEELAQELDAFAAPYTYFGALEGDGADIGYWPSHESIADALHDGDLLAVSDTSEVPADYTGGVWHVNDHGNGTLYAAQDGKLTEVWSIV